MKYLIMKCKPLSDQWECDADRTPLMITDDWQTNAPKNCLFEVWEIDDNGRIKKLIKDYDTPMEWGMIFGYWHYGEFVVVEKYPNRTYKDGCPTEIREFFASLGNIDEQLERYGHLAAYGEDNDHFRYVYSDYSDDEMSFK